MIWDGLIHCTVKVDIYNLRWQERQTSDLGSNPTCGKDFRLKMSLDFRPMFLRHLFIRYFYKRIHYFFDSFEKNNWNLRQKEEKLLILLARAINMQNRINRIAAQQMTWTQLAYRLNLFFWIKLSKFKKKTFLHRSYSDVNQTIKYDWFRTTGMLITTSGSGYHCSFHLNAGFTSTFVVFL